MDTISKHAFQIKSIDSSHYDYDLVETIGFGSCDVDRFMKRNNNFIFKISKGEDLFEVIDPLFNYTLELTKVLDNNIDEINKEIETNLSLRNVYKEFIDNHYYIGLWTYEQIKNEIQKDFQSSGRINQYKGKGKETISLKGDTGEAMFCAGAVYFGPDGSGYVANSNILWDKFGNAVFTGTITSNNNGDRIVINPIERNLKFIGADTGVNVAVGKNITFANPSVPIDSIIVYRADGVRSELTNDALNIYYGGNKTFGTISATSVGFYFNRMEDDETAFEARVHTLNDKNILLVLLRNCPKSPDGLPVGALWNDRGTIKIVE